jgi:hypothetical protein
MELPNSASPAAHAAPVGLANLLNNFASLGSYGAAAGSSLMGMHYIGCNLLEPEFILFCLGLLHNNPNSGYRSAFSQPSPRLPANITPPASSAGAGDNLASAGDEHSSSDGDGNADARAPGGGPRRRLSRQERRAEQQRAHRELRHALPGVFLPSRTFEGVEMLQARIDTALPRPVQAVFYAWANGSIDPTRLPLNFLLKIACKLFLDFVCTYPTVRDLERWHRIGHSAYPEVIELFMRSIEDFNVR